MYDPLYNQPEMYIQQIELSYWVSAANDKNYLIRPNESSMVLFLSNDFFQN